MSLFSQKPKISKGALKATRQFHYVLPFLFQFVPKTQRLESSENIQILFQGVDLYFSNQNDLRNPKMGSKQSFVVPPTTDFFKKLLFDKKNVEKIGHLVDL